MKNEIKKEKRTDAIGGITYKHPAMALAKFSRVTTRGANLFGSSIDHDHYIKLSISPAEVTRSLSHDWYHQSRIPMIEVAMTSNQFAELITSMNCGEGIPCTLQTFNGEHFDLPEMETKAEQFKAEVMNDVSKAVESIDKAAQAAKELLNQSKPLTKTEKTQLLNDINAINRLMHDHLPFILESFQEQMEKSVVEAKSAIDAFVEHTITKTGIEALRDQNVKLLEEKGKTE